MRIGIDAKWYFDGPPSGRVVVKNYVDHLIKINHNHIIYLFFKEEEKEKCLRQFDTNKNVKLIFIKGKYNFLINMVQIQNYAKKNDIDIILYQNFISFFPSKKIKHVAYIHDFLFLDYPQYYTFFEKIVYRLMKVSAKKSDHIITISNSEKDRIIRHCGIKPEKVSFIYHGIDEIFHIYNKEEINRVRTKYNLPSEYLLFIGRLNERKNIKTLLESLFLLKSDIKLVIIGKEDNKIFDLSFEVNRLKIRNRVLKLGFVENSDMAKILSGAKIFVFPSYAEGFGLPPIEAMRSGVPTIVSKTTSLPEICGESAIYFDVNSKFDLKEKIELILNNEKLYKQLKDNGIEQSFKYNWEQSSNEMIKVLEMVKDEY